MTSIILTTGATVGALLGLVHARGVYATRTRQIVVAGGRSPAAVRAEAAYSAAWTVGLWTLFGSYVLALWVVSIPVWLGFRAARGVRS